MSSSLPLARPLDKPAPRDPIATDERSSAGAVAIRPTPRNRSNRIATRVIAFGAERSRPRRRTRPEVVAQTRRIASGVRRMMQRFTPGESEELSSTGLGLETPLICRD